MSLDRAASDWWDREILGYSQERIDRIHKLTDEYHDVFGARLEAAPQELEDLESDSDFDGPHLALLSPPQTPKSEGLSQPVSDHTQRVWPTSTPQQKSGVGGRKSRAAVSISKR